MGIVGYKLIIVKEGRAFARRPLSFCLLSETSVKNNLPLQCFIVAG